MKNTLLYHLVFDDESFTTLRITCVSFYLHLRVLPFALETKKKPSVLKKDSSSLPRCKIARSFSYFYIIAFLSTCVHSFASFFFPFS